MCHRTVRVVLGRFGTELEVPQALTEAVRDAASQTRLGPTAARIEDLCSTWASHWTSGHKLTGRGQRRSKKSFHTLPPTLTKYTRVQHP